MTKREYTPITDETGFFELLVKHYENGPVSTFLHSRKPGDQVMMRGMFGSLVWAPETMSKQFTHLLLIGAGSGITPLYQIVKAALTAPAFQEAGTKISLVFANRTSKDILLNQALNKLGERISIKYVLSRPSEEEREAGSFLVGRLDEAAVFGAAVGECLAAPAKPLVLICGPDAFCVAVKALAESQSPTNPVTIHVF